MPAYYPCLIYLRSSIGAARARQASSCAPLCLNINAGRSVRLRRHVGMRAMIIGAIDRINILHAATPISGRCRCHLIRIAKSQHYYRRHTRLRSIDELMDASSSLRRLPVRRFRTDAFDCLPIFTRYGHYLCGLHIRAAFTYVHIIL